MSPDEIVDIVGGALSALGLLFIVAGLIAGVRGNDAGNSLILAAIGVALIFIGLWLLGQLEGLEGLGQ